MTQNTKKTLYFEGAGWSGADISKATVGNCRIRTAFHLDDGRAVYLEIIACAREAKAKGKGKVKQPFYEGWVDHCHYITGSADDCNCSRVKIGHHSFEYNHTEILRFVNSLGCSFDAIEVVPDLGGYRVFKDRNGYNYGDEFQIDRDLIAAREAVDAYMMEQERRITGRKWPAYSLWVDANDPAILHFDSHCKGRKYDLCVAVPKSLESLPVLNKANAVPGCFYAWCDSSMQVYRVYRISEACAEENELMYLDRVETSAGDFALPGSDVYHHKGTR